MPGLRRLRLKLNESWRQLRNVSRSACKKFKNRKESKLRRKTKECSASMNAKKPKNVFFSSNFKFKKIEKC